MYTAAPTGSVGPILRWAGGKQKLARELLQLAPDACDRYFEPFLGAGSLFLSSQYERCYLSDINARLMNAYIAIRDRPDLVARYARAYELADSRSFYMDIRAHERRSPYAEAARFLYLNRAGYSGIYRVNSAGTYNVPYGPGRTGLLMPSANHIHRLADQLRGRACSLISVDFRVALNAAGTGDFVYLDPPYEPTSDTEFFHHYAPVSQSRCDTDALLRVLEDLTRRGAKVLMTIRASEASGRLFADYDSTVLTSPQWLSVKRRGARLMTQAVTNYRPRFSPMGIPDPGFALDSSHSRSA